MCIRDRCCHLRVAWRSWWHVFCRGQGKTCHQVACFCGVPTGQKRLFWTDIIISPYHHHPRKIIFGHHPKSHKVEVFWFIFGRKLSKKIVRTTFTPLRQKSYRAEIKLIRGHFSRRICLWRSKMHSSSKIWVSTQNFTEILEKKLLKIFLEVGKWNVGDRLKRVFPKFGADRSYVPGVNCRSKFRKIVHKKNRSQKK